MCTLSYMSTFAQIVCVPSLLDPSFSLKRWLFTQGYVPSNQTLPSLPFINYLNVCVQSLWSNPFFYLDIDSPCECVFPLIKPLPPFFFCQLFECLIVVPSIKLLPPFLQKISLSSMVCANVCALHLLDPSLSLSLVDYLCVICTSVCALPLIKPLPFFLYDFLFIYLIIRTQSMWMYVEPPIKPLLFFSMNFFLSSQLSTHKCVHIFLN
jgi:hypothetical protein